MTILARGMTAPDFTLPTDDRASFTLSAHRGTPVLLYFYPQADTPGCTSQNLDFSKNAQAFEQKGILVVGISPDPAEKLARFRDKHGLTQTLLADPEHIAISAYGVWGEKRNYGRTYLGLIRSTFLVGPDGTIQQAWLNVRAKGHVDRLLKELA